MATLTKLYEARTALEKKEVTNTASALKRHAELRKLEAEIAYYEQGEFISRMEIQGELAEIAKLEAERDALSQVIKERKTALNKLIFGSFTTD